MAKRKDPNAVHHWIFYWNDGKYGRPVEFIRSGSRGVDQVNGNVLKGGGFDGTEEEAKALADKLNKKYAVKLPKNYTGAAERNR